MKTIIKKLAGLSFLLLLGTVNIYAATHTVTNSNDAGAGSLRQTIQNANSGDSIVFAPNISTVNLTGSDIVINKNLTIIGGTGNDKTTIRAGTGRIFNINGNFRFTVCNLILTGANHNFDGGAVNVTNNLANNAIFVANDCIFSNNYSERSGAVSVPRSTFIANNCVFINNRANSGGGAVDVFADGNFIAIDCAFINNSSREGGAVRIILGRFAVVNSTFNGNSATTNGGAIYNDIYGSTFLYHITVDENQTTGSGGGIYSRGKLYLYNSIIAGNTPNQIEANVWSNGTNLIEGENGVTRELVFGNNVFSNGYIMPLEYAKTATKLDNTIQVPSGITIAEVLAKLATDQIGTVRPTTDNVTYGAVETAIIPPEPTIRFYIRASKHPLTDPTRRNYQIPIFIKADEDISNTVIDSLVIEIDRRIFYPRRVDNGDMSLHFKDTVIKMTFENVTVPELKANEEKVLLTIRGDVLLGEIDSSEIKIDTVVFAEDLSEKPDLIHGFITLDICVEGGGLRFLDYEPLLTVKNNPVSEMLEIECKTIENGDYSLEIVDMLGKSETVREFTVSASGKRIFDFEIPISNFSSGAYFIIMNTPTAKYSTKFVVQ